MSEVGDSDRGRTGRSVRRRRAPERAPRARRTRKIFSGVFVVLFCISLLVTVLSVWSVRQVLNTNAFAGHVEVALKSPAVQTELSNYVTEGSRAGGPAREDSGRSPAAEGQTPRQPSRHRL